MRLCGKEIMANPACVMPAVALPRRGRGRQPRPPVARASSHLAPEHRRCLLSGSAGESHPWRSSDRNGRGIAIRTLPTELFGRLFVSSYQSRQQRARQGNATAFEPRRLFSSTRAARLVNRAAAASWTTPHAVTKARRSRWSPHIGYAWRGATRAGVILWG
jgi:hypothetical protein